MTTGGLEPVDIKRMSTQFAFSLSTSSMTRSVDVVLTMSHVSCLEYYSFFYHRSQDHQRHDDHESWFMFRVLLFHHGVIDPSHIPQHFYHHGQDHYDHHHHQVFLVLWWWMGMLLFLATIRLFYRAIQCKYDQNIC